MENCIRRFPVVGAMIFNNLCDQNLVRSKKIGREISKFIKNERFYWVRIIRKYNNDWRYIIKKTSIKNLKDLAIESEKLYWISIIDGFKQKSKGHEEAWNEVVDNFPINIVRQLAVAVGQYFKLKP